MKSLIISNAFPMPGQSIRMWSIEHINGLGSADVETRSICFYPKPPKLISLFVPKYRKYSIEYGRPQISGGVEIYYVPVSLGSWGYSSTAWQAAPLRYAEKIYSEICSGLERYIDDFKPDVIYAIGLVRPAFLSVRIGRKKKIPVVISAHCFGELDSCETKPEFRELVQQNLELADHLTVTSSLMKDKIRGLDSKIPITAIPNSVPDPIQDVQSRPRPVELQDRFVVFSCGTMVARKRFHDLVEAFAQVAASYPDMLLRIAGSGPDMPKIEQLVERWDLTSQVKLLGRIDHHQVMQEMAWADLFALPSRNEAYGVVYAEAASYHTPSMYASDSGIVEFFSSHEPSLVVAPNGIEPIKRGLEWAAENDDLLPGLGEKAYQSYTQSFTRLAFGKAFRKIFEAV